MPQSKKFGLPLLIGDFLDEEKQNHQAVQNTQKEVSEIRDMLDKTTRQERDMKQKKKSIIDQQTKLKQTHSNLLMEMTKLRSQIREGDESKKSSDDLVR